MFVNFTGNFDFPDLGGAHYGATSTTLQKIEALMTQNPACQLPKSVSIDKIKSAPQSQHALDALYSQVLISFSDQKGQALFQAFEQKKCEAALELLQGEVKPNLGTKEKWALSLAMKLGWKSVARLLLEEYGVSPDIKAAVLTKDPEVVRLHLQHFRGEANEATRNMLAECVTDALWKDKPEIALELLNYRIKPNVNHVDAQGGTMLGYAAARGYEAVVKCLVEMGALPDSSPRSFPLHYAVKGGHHEICMLLLPHADLNRVDADKKTVAERALILEGQERVDRLLIIQNIALQPAAQFSEKELKLAINEKFHEAVGVILQYAPTIPLKQVEEALQLSMTKGTTECAEALMCYRGVELATPRMLQHATEMDYLPWIELLLQYGAKSQALPANVLKKASAEAKRVFKLYEANQV